MDDLSGNEAVWDFDGETIVIRYETKGWFKSPLLKWLGSLTVPVSAVESVDFEPKAARKKGWVLTLRLRERTDPYLAVGSGLDPKLQPFRLTGPARTELVAEYIADQMRFAAEQVQGPPDPSLPTRLVPALPLQITTCEGTAVLDADGLRLMWSGGYASGYKRKQQRREYALSEITGAETVPMDDEGWTFLRVLTTQSAKRAATKPKHDLEVLRADEEEDGHYQAFLMAAAITAHVWARRAAGQDGPGAGAFGTRPAITSPGWWREATQNVAGALAAPRAFGPSGGDGAGDAGPGAQGAGEDGTPGGTGHETEWVYAQIERMGELRDKGLLTEEEFGAKKAELLRRI